MQQLQFWHSHSVMTHGQQQQQHWQATQQTAHSAVHSNTASTLLSSLQLSSAHTQHSATVQSSR